MSKKIVIIPTFCESHLIKYQIPNIIDTIDPDYIIYNEGMFPNGTEGNKQLDKKWLDKYTLNGEGKRGFDYNELKQIIEHYNKQYPDVEIILNEMEYTPGMSSTDCYTAACTNWAELGIEINEGDFIFPYEGDVFHHEDSKTEIQGYLDQLKPDTGFRSNWIDFMENQYYVENSYYDGRRISRRIAICFGTMEWYLDVLSRFMTKAYEDYDRGYGILYPTDLTTFHYAWWRPGKFKELRCDQLQRDPYYWPHFTQQLSKANSGTEEMIKIRYNKPPSDPEAYIKFTREWNHPEIMKQHECWVDESLFTNL